MMIDENKNYNVNMELMKEISENDKNFKNRKITYKEFINRENEIKEKIGRILREEIDE